MQPAGLTAWSGASSFSDPREPLNFPSAQHLSFHFIFIG
jgi:hypothetical protein